MQISFYCIYMAEEDIWLACESAGNLYYSLTQVIPFLLLEVCFPHYILDKKEPAYNIHSEST